MGRKPGTEKMLLGVRGALSREPNDGLAGVGDELVVDIAQIASQNESVGIDPDSTFKDLTVVGLDHAISNEEASLT